MSHMIYPNLAVLENFNQDLNYTGIISEGWNAKWNLFPLALLVLCLTVSGVPRGFQSWWALVNTAIFHPMDL